MIRIYKYKRFEEKIYFDTLKRTSLDNLEPGDYFKIYLGRTINQSNTPDRFYGKLVKKTEMKIKCYILTNANKFGMTENNSMSKKGLQESLKKEYFFNQDRILDIFKVTIREENEFHEYEHEQHPSTFMNEDEYELI